MYDKWETIESENDNLWSSTRFYSRSPIILNYSTPSLYADDTEIYASSNDCGDFVHKINNDLENIRKWMIKNKLQIHPSKSKHMFIASAYNHKNKPSDSPTLINNKPIPKIDHYSCLGVNMDERMHILGKAC